MQNKKGRSGTKTTMTVIKRITTTAMSTLVSLAMAGGLSEAYLRYQLAHHREQSPFSHNPVIAAQSSEEVFFPDPRLGHRLSPDFADVFGEKYDSLKAEHARKSQASMPSSFIGRNKIVTLDEIVRSLTSTDTTNSNTPVILHLGDSSTSGWDSDVVTRNRSVRHAGMRAPPKSLQNPFFQYATYSDILADKGLISINAGTPGYTSTQGVRYIKKLLQEFKQKGVSIDYVTIYFGNNDSVWNGNAQDKYVIPEEEFNGKVIGALKTAIQRFAVYPRVDVEEYKEQLGGIIGVCREYGATPILIQPVIPTYWHPGLRAEGTEAEMWEEMYKEKGKKAVNRLGIAIQLYRRAEWLHHQGGGPQHKEDAKKLFIEAQQFDWIVPRIKPEYVQALHDLSNKTGAMLVNVQDQIPDDDRSYFIDYCHPDEPANRLIASAIEEAIAKTKP